MDISLPTFPEITPEILSLIASLDEFKWQWRSFKRLSRDQLSTLRKIATVESVGSSTRIEWSKLTDQEVSQLLSGLTTQSFTTRDEEEVGGYAQVMELIFDSFEHIPLSENYIQQLHTQLLQYSTKDTRHRGKYKTLSNTVAAFDENGNELGIIFQTATPFATPFAMQKLVIWFQDEEKEMRIHPLLRIGMFIVSFLAIHPFQDGNGRLSRILTTLLLLKYGYTYVPYTSLESIIEESKDRYYVWLRQTQTTLENPQPNWEPWLLFFLRCLVRQKNILEQKILQEEKRMSQGNPLVTKILQVFDHGERFTIYEMTELVDGNRNTLKLYLRKLVKNGQIRMHGKGRGVFYTRV